MIGPDHTSRTTSDDPGSDERAASLTRGLGSFVPAALARRAIDVSVSTDRDVYDREEPVSITVEFANRLPLPVSVPTPTRRRWGWAVDDLLEASDERLYASRSPATFDFAPRERKRIRFDWDGRLERTDGTRESIPASSGEHEIAAFVATDPEAHRPRDATTISIR